MLLLTRASDGRLLASVRFDGASVLLDVETESPNHAAQAFYFIRGGPQPAVAEWAVVPWGPRFEGLRVITYDAIVRPNIDLVRYLRAAELERRRRYDAIPARVRRHDRA